MMKSVMRNSKHPNIMAPMEKGRVRYLQRFLLTPLLRNMIASVIILPSLLVALAEKPGNTEDQSQFECTIGNRKIQFTDFLKATLTKDGTLSIFGVGKAHEHLFLSLPILKKGTFTLQDTPAMRLDYSRNLASSNLSDHFHAHKKRSASQLKVTISKLDTKDGWIEGTFSSTAHTIPSGKALLKEGVFKLHYQLKSTDKKQTVHQSEVLKSKPISEARSHH